MELGKHGGLFMCKRADAIRGWVPSESTPTRPTTSGAMCLPSSSTP